MKKYILWCRKAQNTFLILKDRPSCPLRKGLTTENRTLELSPKAIFLFSIVLFNFYNILAAQEEVKWSIEKNTHFIVYYKNASPDFITQLIDKSEDYYNKIADDLGFRRFDFWLWDNRAKIYIYNDALDYQRATGQPSWSSGAAIAGMKMIATYPNARGFFDTILPHEMGHIIFREFVGFDNYAIPLWLEEGVASYQEKFRRSIANKIVKEALKKNTFIDLEKLSNFNPRSVQNSALVNLFYAESLSIIDFLIKEFGKDNFVVFCRNLRDKKNLERAVASSYPFSNIQELNRAWQGYLSEDISYGTK